MTEREHRDLAGSGEPAVTDVGALRSNRWWSAIPNGGVDFRQLWARCLIEIDREGDRQPARRIHPAGNDFRDRPATLPDPDTTPARWRSPHRARASPSGFRSPAPQRYSGWRRRRRRSARLGPTAATGRRCRSPRLRRGSRTRSRRRPGARPSTASAGLMTGIEFDLRVRKLLSQLVERARRQQVQIAHAGLRTDPADRDHVRVPARRQTALEPKPAGTPSCAWPPMTAMRAAATSVSQAAARPGSAAARSPDVRPRKAISLCASMFGGGRGFPLVDSDGEYRPQDPPHHVRQALLGQPAVGIGGAQRVSERLRLPQASRRSGRRTPDPGRSTRTPSSGVRAPVRHHPTAVSPRTFQHVVDQDIVCGGVVAVDLVVGRHHRAGLATARWRSRRPASRIRDARRDR